MTFTQGKPSRRKAYLKHRQNNRTDDTHHADLMNSHPDWIRPTQSLIDKVLDRTGKPIEKHRYIPVERVEPIHKVHLGDSVCGRFVSVLHIQGSTYWIQEHDTLLNTFKSSLNYGSGDLAKKSYQMGSVTWS